MGAYNDFMDELQSETVTVTATPTLLGTLLEAEAFSHAVRLVRIQNLDASLDAYHSVAPSRDGADAPAAVADMGIIPSKQIMVLACPRESAERIYVCGSSASHKLHVWQGGTKR